MQRLRFNNKPLVQIVYLPKEGAPIALCVMKEVKPDAAVADQKVASMTVVTWRQAELGYALIGQPQGVDLTALGKQISQQPGPRRCSAVTSHARKRFAVGIGENPPGSRPVI